MHDKLRGVPEAVRAALGRLQDELARAAGANFAGLVLYGGLARGRYRPGKSDVNVVVLLNDASSTSLAAIVPALRAAKRAAAIDPLLLTPAEVPRIAAAFPTKLLDIKNHHICLVGVDPFASLDVPREQVRLRITQALENVQLRLRRDYVAFAGDTRLLRKTLARAARPIAIELTALLQLAGKDVPAEDRSAAVFEAASTAFGLAREPLSGLAELRQNNNATGDVDVLYRGVLQAIAQAIAVVDAMQEPPR